MDHSQTAGANAFEVKIWNHHMAAPVPTQDVANPKLLTATVGTVLHPEPSNPTAGANAFEVKIWNHHTLTHSTQSTYLTNPPGHS